MTEPWGEGHVIMGRYQLRSLLGAGGMGSVWRAEHVQLKSEVAVKLLDPAIAQNEEMLARFLREARACAALKNRHIVQVYDHGVENGTAFMVMELLHGETLGARLQREGKLPIEDTIKFLCQVMRAIGRAHDAGVIHRDLKPDNIFLCTDEDDTYAKVLDFGVAKVSSGELDHAQGVKTQTGMMIGTPFYMSPEQAKAKAVDPRTDVWALAVITYECLTGKRPFTGDSFADLIIKICSSPIPLPSKLATVPVGFDEWFVKGTQRDVERRFRSAREMADELMQLAAAPLAPRAGPSDAPGRTLGAPAARTPMPARDARPNRLAMTTGQSASAAYDAPRSERRSRLVPLLAVAGALGVAGAAVYLWSARPGDGAATVVASEPQSPPSAPAALPVASPPIAAPVAERAPPPQAAAAPEAPQTPEPAASASAALPGASAVAPAASADPRSKSSSSPKPSAPSTPKGPTPAAPRENLPPEKWEF